MLGKGIHPKVVQEILGHSQVNITLDVYSHVLPSMQEDVTKGGMTTLARVCQCRLNKVLLF
jgi:site-specific recombinase XerD